MGATRLSAIPALAVLLTSAAQAAAADYTLTRPAGLYEAPPVGATKLGLSTGPGKSVTPPFPVHYFGRVYSTIGVSGYGYLQFGQVPGTQGSSHEALPTTTPQLDGVCALIWSYHRTGTSTTSPNDAYTWTSGTGDARRFVISYENIAFNTIGSHGTFQAQFYETTGRIVIAFKNDGNWTQFEYTCGLDSPGDTRWAAANPSQGIGGFPGNDMQFDPRVDTVSGVLRWDELAPKLDGSGSTTLADRPLGGVLVELRADGANLVQSATTAADGSFAMKAFAVATSSSGAVVVPARNAACTVSTLASQVREWQAAGALTFGGDTDVGARTLGGGADSDGSLRAAVRVARRVREIRDWALARTAAAIPPLAVTLDLTTGPGSAYQVIGAGPPTLFVGGTATTNPDAWDDAALTRTYARHLLRSIAALPATPRDDRYDAVSDPANAFAEAFGDAVWAEMSGETTAVDTRSGAAAEVRDLEAPGVTVTKGPDVAGCVAGALFDLLDPANETIDAVDGSSAAGRVFAVVDSMTTAPTAATFLDRWVTMGYDAPGITRAFVGNGVLADDAAEPNDGAGEAAAFGAAGQRRTGLLLHRANEDWYAFALAGDAASLVADAGYDRSAFDTAIALEVRTTGGALLAAGAQVGATSVTRAATGPVAAGTYLVGVRHLAGATLTSYSLQVFTPLEMAAAPLHDWTVGRAYDADLGVAGGVAPYSLTTVGSAYPPGLVVSPLDRHVVGTPTSAGVFPVTIQLTDAAFPANSATRSQTIVVHDVFRIDVPAFVGFPAGRAVDTTLPTSGGTPPFTVGMSSGALPAGLSAAPGSLRVTGTAAAPGSSVAGFDGADAAGSASHVETRAVACVALTAAGAGADLAAGEDACGFWFDAVVGSTVSVAVGTAKGRAKRTLGAVLLGPDRAEVTGGRVKAKSGGVAASKFVCPLSGRYHLIVPSAAGDATQLVAKLALTPPAKARLVVPEFEGGDAASVRIGAIAGAHLVLKFAGDRKAGLVAKVTGLRDPDGTGVPFAASIVASPLGGTLTLDLAKGGTWIVTLGATSSSGNPGNLTWSYALKQPKGGSYAVD